MTRSVQVERKVMLVSTFPSVARARKQDLVSVCKITKKKYGVQ